MVTLVLCRLGVLCFVLRGRTWFWQAQSTSQGSEHLVVLQLQKDGPENYLHNDVIQRLGDSYDNQGIKGALDVWDKEITDLLYQGDPSGTIRLLEGIVAAFANQRGKITGLLNSLMGSCCLESWRDDGNSDTAAEFALGLLQTYNMLCDWTPDIVTLSLAYAAVCDIHPQQADDILARIQTLHPFTDAKVCIGNSNPLNTTDLQTMVLYEDHDLLVINKPSGASLPEIENVLMSQGIPLSDLNPDGSRGFVHRLDVGTSGCLVVAKNNAMHAKLISQFFLRQVQKSYIAVLCNPSNESELLPKSGNIDLPIDGRPATSSFKVLKKSSLTTMIRVTTQQGRKHQVRIHCSRGLNRPIVLDPLYGGERIMYRIESDAIKLARAGTRFCLHAHCISLSRMGVQVDAPLPDWWKEALEQDDIE